MPQAKVNGGHFLFSVYTKQGLDGWLGVVTVGGVEVWTLDAPCKTQDEAYGATKRAVGKAFAKLLNG